MAVELSGRTLAEVADAIVALLASSFGRGAEEAKAFQNDDLLVVVMRGTFMEFEQELVKRGREDAVRDVRLAWQGEMADEVMGRVASLTGHEVLDYHSQVLTRANVTIELFLLDPGPKG
jgi:uncharacterized protein YbcI